MKNKSKMKESGIKLKLFYLALICFGIFGMAKKSLAADYYVSPTGNAAWAEATNINTPCSAVTAMANAVARDTIYFRGGTYDVAAIIGTQATYAYDSARLKPANSGSSGHPIIFKAYQGETPILNDTLANGVFRTFVIGAPDRDYIIIDGFIVQANNGAGCGTVSLMGGDINSGLHYGNQVLNCTINGGGNMTDPNQQADGIRIQEQDGAIIKGNRIYNMSYGNANYSALKIYHVQNMIVENNELYDSEVGIYDKSWSINNTYRYNYIHGCRQGIRLEASESPYQSGNKYYGNLITVNSANNKFIYSGIEFPGYADFEIYNNTFYSSGMDTQIYTGVNETNLHFYNNIIHSTIGTMLRLREGTTWDEIDYNQYSNHIFSIVKDYGGASPITYSSLNNWKDIPYPGSDAHSLASDPLFVNLSGSMNMPTDFTLSAGSPCKGAGRGGVDMGTDVSLVGIQSEVLPDATPPAAPSGLSVQ